MGPEDYLRDGVLRKLLEAVTKHLPERSDQYVAELVGQLRKSKAKILKQLKPTEEEAAAVEAGFADTATRAQQVQLLKLWVRTLVPTRWYPTVGSFLANYKLCILRLVDKEYLDAFPTIKNNSTLTLFITEWHNVNVGIVPAKPKLAEADEGKLQKIAEKVRARASAARPPQKKRVRKTSAAAAAAAAAQAAAAAAPKEPATPATPATPDTPYVTEVPDSTVAEAVEGVSVEEPAAFPPTAVPPAEVSFASAADTEASAGEKRASVGEVEGVMSAEELMALVKRVRAYLVEGRSGIATLRELAEELGVDEAQLEEPIQTMHEEDILFFDHDVRTVYAL